MSRRSEIVLAGSGGQGVLLAGTLLGEAAILEGANVVQTVSYGIATRGGTSMTEVIIDDAEIVYQQVETPNVVLAMSPEAMKKYEGSAAEGALVIYDTTFVPEREGRNLAGFPFTDTAAKMGNPGLANLIALGFLCTAGGILTKDALEMAISERFSDKKRDANLAALRAGAAAAANVLAAA
ncbi:2-oxoacid:acceptor oxidoreductase family protein [Rhodoplanes elegans]|nr:2-oxoacid:acceptor oxidoreductase family protein [Rhodoplanes elegans]